MNNVNGTGARLLIRHRVPCNMLWREAQRKPFPTVHHDYPLVVIFIKQDKCTSTSHVQSRMVLSRPSGTAPVISSCFYLTLCLRSVVTILQRDRARIKWSGATRAVAEGCPPPRARPDPALFFFSSSSTCDAMTEPCHG